ncbi:hypothetical protein [Actinomadura miaoliensis]|uniref:DUF3761 domain-containing protein n=1 Tax=Actinomadura miaoliensis TaxID=430685 RepID=A0ABP7X7F6_9ACTN
MANPFNPQQWPIFAAVAVAVGVLLVGYSIKATQYEPQSTPPPPPASEPVGVPSPAHTEWETPVPTVINCGPGDDPGTLLLRKEICMSPDPEDEALDRMMKELARQQRELQQRMRSYPPIVPSTPVVPPVGGGTLCADGTWSQSSGRGTCSWHGGEAKP